MILLLALVLAQENVTLVARRAPKSPVIERVAKAGRRLFEKEHPISVEANALEAEHKHEPALGLYDQLAQSLPPDSAAQAAVQLDRSSALLGMSAADKGDAAAKAAAKAMQAGAGAVREQGAYNLGLAFEQMGKPDEATKMYAEALKLDPDDVDAKVNLELLLEKKDEQRRTSPVQQQDKPRQQPKDQPNQQQQQQQQAKENQQQQGGGQGSQKQKEEQQRQAQANPQKPADQKQKEQQQAQKPVDRSEAERLLDALRAGEKNLTAWRFSKEKKEARRRVVEKDW